MFLGEAAESGEVRFRIYNEGNKLYHHDFIVKAADKNLSKIVHPKFLAAGRDRINTDHKACEEWIAELLKKVRGLAERAKNLNDQNELILKQATIHEGIELAMLVWDEHSEKAGPDERTIFLRNFFITFFRNSLVPGSKSRQQWHLLFKEHAIFVTELCAEHLVSVKDVPTPAEF